ncbi:MAG TPA: hypothetical protein VMV23_00285 [Candidatus Nanopelagicaceae bacterium]|nr:hypothetical protein [Candidatus Nanopelagicaceae bacterium]
MNRRRASGWAGFRLGLPLQAMRELLWLTAGVLGFLALVCGFALLWALWGRL